MNIVKLILAILVLLLEIVLVGSVMMQSGQKAGLSAMTGAAETYFSRGKNKSREDRLSLLTKIVVAVLLVLVVLLIVL